MIIITYCELQIFSLKVTSNIAPNIANMIIFLRLICPNDSAYASEQWYMYSKLEFIATEE